MLTAKVATLSAPTRPDNPNTDPGELDVDTDKPDPDPSKSRRDTYHGNVSPADATSTLATSLRALPRGSCR